MFQTIRRSKNISRLLSRHASSLAVASDSKQMNLLSAITDAMRIALNTDKSAVTLVLKYLDCYRRRC